MPRVLSESSAVECQLLRLCDRYWIPWELCTTENRHSSVCELHPPQDNTNSQFLGFAFEIQEESRQCYNIITSIATVRYGKQRSGGGGFPYKGTRGAHHTYGGLKSGFDTSYVQPHEVKVEVFGVPWQGLAKNNMTDIVDIYFKSTDFIIFTSRW